jgi:hypothetical protein
MVPPLAAQRGGAMNRLADAMISSAPAGIGHLGIDVGIRWVRLLLEQRDRSQDLS